MKTFDVYPLYPIEPVKGLGCKLWDAKGEEYLDFYGGHAVISIGHSHPIYVEKLSHQLKNLGFYSNSVQNNLQEELAQQLGEISGCSNYSLFMCNSGAEANENAIKLASFHTQRNKVVAIHGSFHGRTSGAVACTDNKSIVAPFNSIHNVEFVPINNVHSAEFALKNNDVAAVIVEGIQGVGGIVVPNSQYMQQLAELCKIHGTILIVDEVQSGYGRTGKFFAHQHSGIAPDIITVAKGMGNGFPVGGVLISPKFEARHGMLGTTFGGNHLACAASTAVLEVIKSEKLMENATNLGKQLIEHCKILPRVKEVRGIGLMVGIEFNFPIADLRKKLLFEKHIFTGYSGANTIRLLPPLCITESDIYLLVNSLSNLL